MNFSCTRKLWRTTLVFALDIDCYGLQADFPQLYNRMTLILRRDERKEQRPQQHGDAWETSPRCVRERPSRKCRKCLTFPLKLKAQQSNVKTRVPVSYETVKAMMMMLLSVVKLKSLGFSSTSWLKTVKIEEGFQEKINYKITLLHNTIISTTLNIIARINGRLHETSSFDSSNKSRRTK